MSDSPLILGSASPRRQALLKAAGMDFIVAPADIDESEHESGTPRASALKTALAKAVALAPGYPDNTLILTADTIVALGDQVFSKPTDRDEARRMLRQLSGQTHTVFTGLTLMRVGGEAIVDAVAAGVTFNELDDALVDAYLASGEADDKAGSYGIQGLGSEFVACVDGDLTGVIGLPMKRLREIYEEMTGRDPFAGLSLRRIALEAFSDLAALPEACLWGIPD